MIVDFGGGFFLRRATAADRAALAAICLKTGDAGKDASGREDDPDLLGLLFTIPYQVLEPELAFIVDGPSGAAAICLAQPTPLLSTPAWHQNGTRRFSGV
ncbi:hypothetical protein NKJ87_18460 [Mesorhizobium sp. M0027]|uniref:hypothetical protein n=1 Tax=unclassified Mesorhizobium TaxID=325217 RepID=UPI0004225AA3|nr:hypothetical protein [Mesorhizobium sp. LSHC420B00]